MSTRRLSAEERRAQILAAVVPAVLEHGAGVSSRQLADAAGVAEGTIFRAFGDKLSLLRAVVEQERRASFDLSAFEDAAFDDLAGCARELLDAIIAQMTRFMRVVFALAHLVGQEQGEDDGSAEWGEFLDDIARILEHHAGELRVPVRAAAATLATLATTASHTWHDEQPMLERELVLDILLHGLAADQLPPKPDSPARQPGSEKDSELLTAQL